MKMVKNGRENYKFSPNINEFVRSHGSEDLHGLLTLYPIQLYVECFKTAGVSSREELEGNWSEFFTYPEVRETVEDLLSAEESYVELISELDKFLLEYEEKTSVRVVDVGNKVQTDIPLMETVTGETMRLGRYLEKSNFTLFILRKHFVWRPWNSHIEAVEARLGDFNKLGCQVAVVASGNREGGLRWLKEYKSSLPLLLDEEQLMYMSVGIRRELAVAWDLKIFIAYAEAVVGGRVDRLAYPGDDVTVIGGDIIYNSAGRLVYLYKSKEQYDRPSVGSLLSHLQSVCNTQDH